MSDHDPELIKKAARALHERGNDGIGWETEMEAVRRYYRNDARVVLDAVADDLRAVALTGDHPAVAEVEHLSGIIEHHGWCQYSGMSIERCARSVCDCGYEGIVPERDRLRAELDALRAVVAAKVDEWSDPSSDIGIIGLPWAKELRALLDDPDAVLRARDCGARRSTTPPVSREGGADDE